MVTEERGAARGPQPPEDTRAYFRGRCLEKYPTQVAAASWDSVIFDVGRETLQRVPTLEPLRGTKAHVGAAARRLRQRRRARGDARRSALSRSLGDGAVGADPVSRLARSCSTARVGLGSLGLSLRRAGRVAAVACSGGLAPGRRSARRGARSASLLRPLGTASRARSSRPRRPRRLAAGASRLLAARSRGRRERLLGLGRRRSGRRPRPRRPLAAARPARLRGRRRRAPRRRPAPPAACRARPSALLLRRRGRLRRAGAAAATAPSRSMPPNPANDSGRTSRPDRTASPRGRVGQRRLERRRDLRADGGRQRPPASLDGARPPRRRAPAAARRAPAARPRCRRAGPRRAAGPSASSWSTSSASPARARSPVRRDGRAAQGREHRAPVRRRRPGLLHRRVRAAVKSSGASA